MNDHTNQTDWQAIIEKIHLLEHNLVDYGYLGQAMTEAKALLTGFQHDSLRNRLEEIQNDYRLMTDFFANGYQDERREELYDGLVEKLYRLLLDIELAYHKVYDSRMAAHLQFSNAISFDAESIKQNLEAFVSDVALCSLETEENKFDKLRQIHAEHHRYLQHLFDAFLFSPQWNHEFAVMMVQVLVSPTIDSSDAQVLVTALMLGTMFTRDPERLSALVEIYRTSQDLHVRQRGLIGWAFAIDDELLMLFTDIYDQIDLLLNDERTRRDLQELQMQVVYCRNAKRDNDKLQQDIMPTLLKNQDFKMTGSGLVRKETDPLEDILHPEAEEKKMEEMEASMRKMMDMRDQGVDIYFGGFSQMKRFSFFYTLCNWFMPFTPDHPQLQHLPADFLRSSMISTMMSSASFCESDKYSFVLATSAVFNNLPANIKEMLNSGGGVMGMYGDNNIDTHDPRYIRRMYLQDLYRFFSLSDSRHLFFNPFDDEEFIFLNHQVFLSQMGHEARKVQRFLLKQKMYTALSDLYFAFKDVDNPLDLSMEALLYMRKGNYAQAQVVYEQLCDMQPDNADAIAGYAQASFMVGDYAEAADAYQELYELHPEDESTAQNLAISLINNDQAEEGVRMLYRLEYEKPDDLNIKRALAWGQLFLGRTEQASTLYTTILSSPGCRPSDYLNAGYSSWFSGNITEAVTRISTSFEKGGLTANLAENIINQFEKDEHLFQRYNIGMVDRKLMVDMISAQTGRPQQH